LNLLDARIDLLLSSKVANLFTRSVLIDQTVVTIYLTNRSSGSRLEMESKKLTRTPGLENRRTGASLANGRWHRRRLASSPLAFPRRDGKQSAAYFLHARAHPSWRRRELARYLARRRRPLNALWNSDCTRRVGRWRASGLIVPRSPTNRASSKRASTKGSFPAFVRERIGSLKDQTREG